VQCIDSIKRPFCWCSAACASPCGKSSTTRQQTAYAPAPPAHTHPSQPLPDRKQHMPSPPAAPHRHPSQPLPDRKQHMPSPLPTTFGISHYQTASSIPPPPKHTDKSQPLPDSDESTPPPHPESATSQQQKAYTVSTRQTASSIPTHLSLGSALQQDCISSW
jgi:hypothetical protein